MKITWLGHSCFKIASGTGSLVLDPYADGSVPGLRPLRTEADAVYCSHDHHDHNAAALVTPTGQSCPFTVEAISCFHDDKQGRLRGENRIHIISDGVQRIAHLGDLGHIPENEALAKLKGLDALLVPIGGHYTIDAKTALKLCERLQPRIIIPMHYRLGDMGYAVISTPEPFLKKRTDVVKYDTDTLDLTPDTPAQTALLRYCGTPERSETV